MTPEEKKLVELLGTAHGYAVEVGAADGVFTSPTFALEKLGWSVLCVEPNPIFAAKARRNRAFVVEAAASDFNDDSYPFTVCNVDHDCKLHEMQGGSSLIVQHGELERLGWAPKGTYEIQVKVRTLNRLLSEAGFYDLDFLSIDTEGTEDAVLRGLNLHILRPRLIVVENWPGVNKSDHILLPLGYRRIERVMGNYTDWYSL
jgi:FkbM family methyltransferase